MKGFIAFALVSMVAAISACKKMTPEEQAVHDANGGGIQVVYDQDKAKADSDENYSVLDNYTSVFTDPETGCQYIYWNVNAGSLTPRMERKGYTTQETQKGCRRPSN